MFFFFFSSSLGRLATYNLEQNLRLFYIRMYTHAHTYIRAYVWITFPFILNRYDFICYSKNVHEFQTYELKCSGKYFICLFVVYFTSLWIHHRKCRQVIGWSVSYGLGRKWKKMSLPNKWYCTGICHQGRRFLNGELNPGLPSMRQGFYLLGLDVTFRKFWKNKIHQKFIKYIESTSRCIKFAYFCYNIKMYDPTMGLKCTGDKECIMDAETGFFLNGLQPVYGEGGENLLRTLHWNRLSIL
jgi:hypothetical protein